MCKVVVLLGRDHGDYFGKCKTDANKSISDRRRHNLTMGIDIARFYIGFRLCKK